jgi:Flp pilus assembly protein TadG
MSALQYLKETSGNVAILFAMCAFGIISLLGVAIDFQRSVSAEQNIQAALDASSLAAAKSFQNASAKDADTKKLAQNIFAADIRAANANLTCPAPSINLDKTKGLVKASVTCTLPTTFTGLFSMSEMKVSQSSTAAVSITSLDLAMMLDVSGSMGGQKLEDLKTAAKDAVDILITPYSGDRVRIAFNTYSTAINVGDYAEKVKGDNYDKDSALKNCVTERTGIAKFDDDAPAFNKYMEEEHKSVGNKAMSCPSSSIAPLTSKASDLKTEIGKLNAGGWTAGHLGVAWAWYLISPEWDSIWPKASEPLPYNKKDTVKAVILMTDGAFNTYYESGQGDSDKQAKKLCTAMKKEGVIVYSVAFQAPKEGKKILKNCASSKTHYYDAKNGTQLKQAYADIASQLSDLRIAK